MEDRRVILKLRDALANIYLQPSDIERVTSDAGLNLSQIPLGTKSVNNWHNILIHAQQHSQLEALLNIAISEYPQNAALIDAYDQYQRSINLAEKRFHSFQESSLSKSSESTNSLSPLDVSKLRDIEKQLKSEYESLSEHEELEKLISVDRFAQIKWQERKNRVIASIRALETQKAKLLNLQKASGICPYKGLHYYTQDDSDIFCGRELLVDTLVNRVGKSLVKGVRFLAIVGASGIGKSSLLRAGFIPAILNGDLINSTTISSNINIKCDIHLITPTADPIKSLAASLTRERPSVKDTMTLMEDLESNPYALDIFAYKATADHTLIVVDQFEDIFSLCENNRKRQMFIENLITASTAELAGPTIVVIALRADFYHHCAQFESLRRLLTEQQEFIGPMNSEELRRAISEPSTHLGFKFEPGLIERLLQDVGNEPGALPLLSHALQETWLRREGNTLTHSAYHDSGGVRGAIAKTADGIIENLTFEEQKIAQKIFIRLTDFGEGSMYTRRKVDLSELLLIADEEIIQNVLNRLANARLIIIHEQSVEVAHEVLIREWPQLREWLEEDQEFVRAYHRIRVDAKAWRELKKDPGELYRGERLERALRWAASTDQLNTLEQEFLREGKVAESINRITLEQTAIQRERQRIAGELHDSVNLNLYTLVLMSQKLKEKFTTTNQHQEYITAIEEFKLEAEKALREMRLVLFKLTPSDIETVGLVGALRQRLEAVEERAGIKTTLKIDGDLSQLSTDIAEHLSFIAQEALNNALRHSNATVITVQIYFQDYRLLLSIEDNGIGFDITATQGLGLRMINERVGLINGHLQIDSSPDHGTVVQVSRTFALANIGEVHERTYPSINCR